MVRSGTSSSHRLVSRLSGFDCVCFSCLLAASVSSVFMMLYIFFVTLLPFVELSLVGLALDLID